MAAAWVRTPPEILAEQVMPFGEHKGSQFMDLPTGYLRQLAEDDKMSEQTRLSSPCQNPIFRRSAI
jgi:hypothetical protein